MVIRAQPNALGIYLLEVVIAVFPVAGASGALTNWQTGETIAGTEAIAAGPGIDLSGWNDESRNLRFADLQGLDLSSASFLGSWLGNAKFTGAQLVAADFSQADLTNSDLRGANLRNATLDTSALANANLGGATVLGADLSGTTSLGFTKEQLYSTASYERGDLGGITLFRNDLSGWDFSGQNLSGATLAECTLTGTNLTGALVTQANLIRTTSRGFTREQLYSTASYQGKDLKQVSLGNNDLSAWNFSGQNLSGAGLAVSVLTDTDFTGAVISGAFFTGSTGLIPEQLYSTASYQAKNLRRMGLDLMDLTGWDFSGQNLTGTYLRASTLTDADFKDANLARTDFEGSTLTNANLAGAFIVGARLGRTTSAGFTREQLYSTANYRAKDLQRIGLSDNDLSGWDFSSQNLTGAYLTSSALKGANLKGANIRNADLTSSTDLSSASFDRATTYNQWTQFPSDFSPVASGLTFIESAVGDFDADGLLDLSDIDMLSEQIRGIGRWSPSLREMFDLNGDSNEYGSAIVDRNDFRIWVRDVKHTWFGDANLDGEFNNLDIVQLLQAGHYEDGVWANSTWATGDWNADGAFDRFDLLIALQDGGYGKGPRATLGAVPEPAGVILLVIGLACLAAMRCFAMAVAMASSNG